MDDKNFLPWVNLSNYFYISEKDFSTNSKFKVKCKLCITNKYISTDSSSSSNLRKHLKLVHPAKTVEAIAEYRKRKNMKYKDVLPTKQIKLDFKVNQAGIDDLIVDYHIQNFVPFRNVETPAFSNLVKGLRPGTTVMCKKTLTSKIGSRAELFKKRLILQLSEVKYVSTTCDCWKGFRKHYLGMTVHWIDPETLLRKMAPLACRRVQGSVTYDVLATMIYDIHKEFAIQNKVTKTTTDNGSNFVKAFRIYANTNTPSVDDQDEEMEAVDLTSVLSDDQGNDLISLPQHHRCCAHVLNLISTKDAEKAEVDTRYKKLWRSTLAKLQAIWNKQNQSTVHADFINNALGKYLIVPNATRWNSLYDSVQCIDHIVKNQLNNLFDVFDHCGLSRIKEDEMKFIAEYTKVMKPFACALDTLQGEKNSYAGYLLPTLYVLRRKLENLTDSLDFCAPLIQSLLDGINRRFSTVLQDQDFILAAALHPKFQLRWLKNDSEEAAVMSLLKSITQECCHEPQTLDVSASSSSDNADFFDFHPQPKQSTQLEQFLALGGCDLQCISNLPLIKDLFLKYNTAVPSSAAVERLFSSGGLILSKRRGKLSDINLENCILLKGSLNI